jgi:hypothetical protein
MSACKQFTFLITHKPNNVINPTMKNPNRIQRLLTHTTLASLAVVLAVSQAQADFYIATNGSDTNAGDINAPLKSFTGARDKIRALKAAGGFPSTGFNVFVRGGRYTNTGNCALGPSDSGAATGPIVYRPYGTEKVIFDGVAPVNATGFTQVTDATLRGRLNSGAAQTNVYSQVITDPAMITLLENLDAQLSFDDRTMLPATFPNVGMSQVNTTVSTEAASGVGTLVAPLGALYTIKESFDKVKWGAELARIQKARASGYVSADWFKETIQLKSINATSGNIKLVGRTKYGWANAGVERLYYEHLLCELDQPGEWYFDDLDNRLYIWPYSAISSSTVVGAWNGNQILKINGANYIHVRKFIFQALGKGPYSEGAVDVIGGNFNQISGCTFRQISGLNSGVNLNGGTDNLVTSCDFYDTVIASRVGGGNSSSTTVTYGRNTIQNCHYTQIDSRNFYGKACGISGNGNTFKNNLVHNLNGQPITHLGLDHNISLNEIFNVGIEEGDGGAIYTGGTLKSYGNVIKHNFVHHIMSVPGLLGRASFFSDDFDGGETVRENVLFKGGWEAIKMNGGAGHTVERNVVLDCFTGIRNGDGGTTKYNSCMNFLATDPLSTSKENYIGRMLAVCGTPDWQTGISSTNWNTRISSFWLTRYPYFRDSMNAYFSNKRMSAYQCRYYNNMFYSNNQDVNSPAPAAVVGSQAVTLALFVDPTVMNFKFKEPRPAYAPPIPFESIGIYSDTYRTSLPNKNSYRKSVLDHFAPWACHTSDAYNYQTVNARLYYNTGKVVQALAPGVN